jgi:hypothetical protein
VKAKNLAFAKFLADDHVDFDPSKPDAYANFALPFSPFLDTTYNPPDSAVGPTVSIGRRSHRIESVRLEHGVLDLDLAESISGTVVRLVAPDGSIEASRKLDGLVSGHRRIAFGNQVVARGIHFVEIVRDGVTLDSRVVFQP